MPVGGEGPREGICRCSPCDDWTLFRVFGTGVPVVVTVGRSGNFSAVVCVPPDVGESAHLLDSSAVCNRVQVRLVWCVAGIFPRVSGATGSDRAAGSMVGAQISASLLTL